MKLNTPITNLLDQMEYVLDGLTNEQYIQPVKVLSQSSIGQHTRHILEFFTELNKGYENGLVDYDKRIRNHAIESDKFFAINTLHQIKNELVKPDRDLMLHIDYGTKANHSLTVSTNYFRELVYNMEHMVHHMALIRIGTEAITDLAIPESFGIAASTLKFRKTCAQ